MTDDNELIDLDDVEPEVDEEAERLAAEAARRAEQMLAVQLLGRTQQSFPIATYPYDELSKEYDTTERATFDAVEKLIDKGFIDRVGATFDAARVGYSQALCSMSVEAEDLEGVSGLVAECHAINWVVQTDGARNLWFLVLGATRKELEHTLNELALKAGYEIVVLRPSHLFKDRFVFEIDPRAKRLERPSAPINVTATRPAALSDIDRQIVRVLQGDISGERRPFSSIARMTADTCGEHLSEDEVIRRVTRWVDSGVIRRLGSVVVPEAIGYRASALTAWSVPEKLIPVVGTVLAAQPEAINVCEYTVAAGKTDQTVVALLYGRNEDELAEAVERAKSMLAKASIELDEPSKLVVSKVVKNRPARYFYE